MEKVKTNISTIICFCAVFIALQSCRKDPVFNCFVKNGDEITVEREIGAPFENIEIYGVIDLEITQAPEYQLRIEAGEHIESQYTTRIENGTLIIDDESNCRAVRNFKRPKMYVSLPVLKHLEYYGNGTVTNTGTLVTDRLTIDLWLGGEEVNLNIETDLIEGRIHGSTCDLVLSGRTNHLAVYKRGLGKLKAFDLSAQTCFVESYSSTDSEVTVNSILDAKLDFKGNLFYRGDPQLRDIRISHEGRVKAVNK